MTTPRDVYMVNYFPAAKAGYVMWTSYDGALYQADMVVAKSLGFNTLRIFITVANGFSFPTPTSPQLANLVDFYTRAKSLNLRIHLTLFDAFGNFGQITNSKTWVTAILTSLPDTTALQAIELQNEQHFASTATYSGGFDAGWPSDTTKYTVLGQVCLVWTMQLMPFIRTLLPSVPVVISTNGEDATYPNAVAGLVVGVTTLTNTPADPDWWEYHCYMPNGGHRISAYYLVQQAIKIVGDSSRLFIGETGYSPGDYAANAGLAGILQQYHADWHQSIRWACQQLEVPEPAPWMLYDVTANAAWSANQYMGLLDTNGNAKEASRLYIKYPLGSRVPSIDINSTMEGIVTDQLGNTTPRRWRSYNGATQSQPITTVIDTSTRYQGHPTMLLTGSSASVNTDNPPGVYIEVGSSIPVIETGRSYTMGVAMKGSGATLSPSLTISWYGVTGYINGTNTSSITLGTSFVQYTLTGTAPAGAIAMRLSVNTPKNAGSIWVGGAVWKSDAGQRLINRGGWLRVGA